MPVAESSSQRGFAVRARASDLRFGDRSALWAAALLVAVALVYSNALHGPFFHDDALSIQRDPHTRVLWPLHVAAWAEYESPMAARPIPSLSRSLNYALGGFDPAGYKALNLLLHVACALALFGLLRRTLVLPALVGAAAPPPTRALARLRTPIAFAAALLWAVHPLTSEVVVYVTQRTESWMALFLLSALYATARAIGTSDAAAAARWRAGAVAACWCGMASKESMVVAPLAVLAYEAAYRGVDARRVVAQHSVFYAALAASWALLVALMMANGRGGTVGANLGITPLEYLWNQCWVIPRYFALVLWPSGQAFDWGIPRPLGLAQVWPGALLLVALFAGAAAATCWRPPVGLPLVAVFALLAPTSSVVPIVTEVGAERRMYLPLALIVAWLVCATARALSLGSTNATGAARRTFWGAACAVLVLAGVSGAVTHARVDEFRTAVSLWRHNLAAFPDVARAHSGLGIALRDEGDFAGALASFDRCFELDPALAECHAELGVTLLALGRRNEARTQLERAVALAPRNDAVLYNWAVLLLEDGELERALPVLREVLRVDPNHAGAAARLALSLLGGEAEISAKRLARARELAVRAVALEQRPGLAQRALAAVSAAAGDYAEAQRWAQRAAEDPAGQPSERALAERDLAYYRRGERPPSPATR